MRVALVKCTWKQQPRENQGNGFMVGKADGCLIVGSVDTKDAIFLPERDSQLSEEIEVAIYRTAVNPKLMGKISGAHSPWFEQQGFFQLTKSCGSCFDTLHVTNNRTDFPFILPSNR